MKEFYIGNMKIFFGAEKTKDRPLPRGMEFVELPSENPVLPHGMEIVELKKRSSSGRDLRIDDVIEGASSGHYVARNKNLDYQR